MIRNKIKQEIEGIDFAATNLSGKVLLRDDNNEISAILKTMTLDLTQ